MLALSLASFAVLASSSAIAVENVAPESRLYYEYTTQALCDTRHGASAGYVPATYRLENNYKDLYCDCAPSDGSLDRYYLCAPAVGAGKQAYCLGSTQVTKYGSASPAKADCDVCSRVAGSPGTRSVFCQDSAMSGAVIRSDYCAKGQNLYRYPNGDCECLAASQSGATKCPVPKAGGYATCRATYETFTTQSQPDLYNMVRYLGPLNKCEFKCNAGLHASPSEKPVTCCKAGYRSNSSGLCSKSKDGKQ